MAKGGGWEGGEQKGIDPLMKLSRSGCKVLRPELESFQHIYKQGRIRLRQHRTLMDRQEAIYILAECWMNTTCIEIENIT